jgi:hypothetical protein
MQIWRKTQRNTLEEFGVGAPQSKGELHREVWAFEQLLPAIDEPVDNPLEEGV